MISRLYFPWISLAKTGKPKKNNEKKPLPTPINRFLGKFANPIPEQFSVFSESIRNGVGNKQSVFVRIIQGIGRRGDIKLQLRLRSRWNDKKCGVRRLLRLVFYG